MNGEFDAHSRGWGLLLRLAGAVVPLAALFALLHAGVSKTPFPLRAIALVWAWPWGAYRLQPLGFGVMGLLTLLFVAGLLVRKDWRGATAVLIWSLFWGWVILAYVITDLS